MNAIRTTRPGVFPGPTVSSNRKTLRLCPPAPPRLTLTCRWCKDADGRLTCAWQWQPWSPLPFDQRRNTTAKCLP